MQNNIKHSVYIETYGCQMNINDTGIIHRIMLDNNYSLTDNISEATIIFINTCAVREHAERRVYNRIITISHLIKKSKYKIILGILGCMAERLKENLFSFNPFIDLIVGPDEYKKLPTLIENCFEKYLKDIAVSSNNLEDYGDIIPVNKSSISSFISIMRGCNNFCSYCVVPYTRGRERSRSNLSIIKEIEYLVSNSIKEIYLLGQNVNSYSFNEIDFSQLLGNIAKNFSNI